MKKLYYLIVLTLVLGLVLSGCLLSNVGQVPTTEQSEISYLTKHTVDDPQVIDLLAGQTIDVGDVLVWNDGDYLYVRYVITDSDWCLTETHLQVATSLDGIPQTKTGNPKPGQFEENDEHDCVTEVEYKYNLIERGWSLDQNLSIAAHAVVKNLTVIESEIQTYDWGRSTESPEGVLFGSSLGSAVDAGFVLPINSLQIVWNIDEYQEISGTTTDEFYATWDQWHGGPNETFEVRHFQAFFDIPEEINLDYVDDVKIYSPYYTAEDIPINDNLYVKLNDNYVGEKGTSYPGSTQGPSSSIPYTDGWYSSGSFITGGGYLIHGQNKLDFVAEEYWWWGGMSKLDVKILWHETETAWADGFGFPGKNWATYFTYGVQGWHSVEELTIEAKSTTGMDSSSTLELGKSYMFKASSTWQDKSMLNHYIDAEYTTFGLPIWDTPTDGTTSWGPDQKDLQVNGQFVDWGVYSSDHVYTLIFDGTDSKVNFRVFDGTANTLPPVMMPSWYPDNEGSLTVEIFKWY